MRSLILIGIICGFIWSCSGTKPSNTTQVNEANTTVKNDTVKISNPEIGYDVIIIEPGFNTWLSIQAKPRGFYTKANLQSKNSRYVSAWNTRVLQPNIYDSRLYEMQINYDMTTDYGFEVNYKLYNYFIYFQNKYKQNLLGTRVPTN